MKPFPSKPSTKPPSYSQAIRSSISGKDRKSPVKQSDFSPSSTNLYSEDTQKKSSLEFRTTPTEVDFEPFERLTSSLPTSQVVTENMSDISSITQTTFEKAVARRKERATNAGRKSQDDYHPSKDKEAAAAPSKGYTPKSSKRIISPSEDSNAKTKSLTSSPLRSSSPRTPPVLSPMIPPRDRARANRIADERLKALEEEYQRQLEIERDEVMRQQDEKRQIIQYEEER